jgi:hypothetical protein
MKSYYRHDIQDDNRLIGEFPTVECTKTFKIGHSTLLNVLKGSGVYKGRLYRREPLTQ